eukprot:scaffold10644_cov107-Isochrysis_galbana.AAC.2
MKVDVRNTSLREPKRFEKEPARRRFCLGWWGPEDGGAPAESVARGAAHLLQDLLRVGQFCWPPSYSGHLDLHHPRFRGLCERAHSWALAAAGGRCASPSCWGAHG